MGRGLSVQLCRFGILFLASGSMVAYAAGPKGVNWPGFRGTRAKGVAEGYPTPTKWNVPKSENILWKRTIPGLGHASPIVWGDRIFVATAVRKAGPAELKVGLYGSGGSAEDMTTHSWRLYCIDKHTGKTIWKRTAHKGVPKVKRHTKASHANCTPATDGKHVVVFFGSEGLYCYDMKGRLRWKKDLGILDAGPYNAPGLQWGYAGSPVLHRGKVIIQCDTHGDSFVAAFDVKEGRELWRAPRDEVSTWSTPTIHKKDGITQVIVNGYKHIGGYDLETGKERWRLTGGGDVPVPTPVSGRGLIFITNAHGAVAPLYAIRPTAQGDISLHGPEMSNDHIAWSVQRNGAYMQTPLVYGDYIYSCSDRGVLKCYEAGTGKLQYRERLGGGGSGFTASPVAADGKIYFVSEDGDATVIRPGSSFGIMATNPMGDICMATPAISEGVLFFRTRGSLIAVADTQKTQTR
ncbi:MAG: PQQ-binding-like beta-propeller repeat protein [Phycisphaerae bacterium]